jgi:iron complex transport system permease protein
VGASFRFLQLQLLPVAAFAGSLLTTTILYKIASREGRTSVAIFLLAGLAIAAIANAGIGLLVFVADDRQLRDITFWLLGSLSGATWPKAGMVAPVALLSLLIIPLIARGLDVLVLGEAEAFHTGIDVERLKKISIVMISAMTGVAVSICGVIGFVGIVVPHLLRIVIGPGHRMLLPASVCLGAILLILADTIARSGCACGSANRHSHRRDRCTVFLFILLRQRALIG